MDVSKFFAAVRGSLFGGRLTQPQVDGLSAILEGGQARMLSVPALAYALATAYHETARTMQPIREYGGAGYFFRMYDPGSPDPGRAALARANGALPGDGVLFYGRGYVQLTWRPNYARAGAKVGIDLVADPDKALDPKVAARILFEGMSEGWFTGKRLGDYFKPGAEPDWRNARRIINGMDKADEIARHAQAFASALVQGD